MKSIIAIIGARPQFIKHAPIELAFQRVFRFQSIHTGQHYDENMSQIFFDQLGMQPPAWQLSVGSANHGAQTGRMMIDIEAIVEEAKPDAILVYGDTNSTLAGALVGAKLHIPIIHLEAGLRSFNRDMPEEVNRVLTDHVSAMLLAPTQQAIENLAKEGITDKVHLTGDVMSDMVEIARERGIIAELADREAYYYCTLHRPYNTDQKERLAAILFQLNRLPYPVKMALHPRTKARMQTFGLAQGDFTNIQFLPPASYFDNLSFMANARTVLTDSGGMQKEAYILQRPCVTIRSETEWLETLRGNWNVLVFDDLTQLPKVVERETGPYVPGLYGDGHAAEEILNLVEAFFKK
ncbi:MAG: UDP-N-acetylglucosamine 2-epimerase (non-hydrolyzing) [Bacteroidota bacterium]